MRTILALTTAAIALGYANAAPRVEPQLTTAFKPNTLPPPKPSNRGSASKYPFDSLTEVGMAFGVKNKDARGLSSIVSNQNKKHRASDGQGGTTQTKRFQAVDVDAEYAKTLKGTPLEGSKALIVRVDPKA